MKNKNLNVTSSLNGTKGGHQIGPSSNIQNDSVRQSYFESP